MVMLDDNMLNKEWIQEMDDAHFRMWISLLLIASKKTGIFEANMRNINFMANTSKKFGRDDLLNGFNGMIQIVPGHEDKFIITEYIRHNWCKDGRELDPVKNRLDRAIVKELNQYGLTVDKLNEMSKHKIKEACDDSGSDDRDRCSDVHGVSDDCKGVDSPDTDISNNDMVEMFTAFWSAYPGTRKQDKRKCEAKFAKIIGLNPDKGVSMFNKIMNGLAKWKTTDTWTKDGGQYVCAPLVWLNNERWDAEIKAGASNGYTKFNHTANANCTVRDDSTVVF